MRWPVELKRQGLVSLSFSITIQISRSLTSDRHYHTRRVFSTERLRDSKPLGFVLRSLGSRFMTHIQKQVSLVARTCLLATPARRSRRVNTTQQFAQICR